MSEHIEHAEHHDDGHHVDYKKIYITLLILLVISVVGPFFEILWVTLITAFGIAIVKATLVVQNFMHLKVERAIIKWMLATSLVLMGLLFFGVAPDVMKHEGSRWVNVAALAAIDRGIPLDEKYGGDATHAEDGEDGDHAEDGEATEPAAAVTEAAFDPAAAYATICAGCHGAGGAGDGPAGAALDPSPASFTDAAFWADRDEDRIVTVILEGAQAVGGSALMAGWSALYDEDQARQIAQYIRTFAN
jgi:caa(3)-type oxidase subunit IV